MIGDMESTLLIDAAYRGTARRQPVLHLCRRPIGFAPPDVGKYPVHAWKKQEYQ